jgi:ankyrin repeat protein
MTNSMGYIPQTPIPHLHRAAMRGDADEIDAVLEAARDGDSGSGSAVDLDEVHNGVTALHLSARNGHVQAGRRLLEKGARVDATGRMGSTALHWAVARGHSGVARMLVEEHGADPHVKDHNGQEPPTEELAKLLRLPIEEPAEDRAEDRADDMGDEL